MVYKKFLTYKVQGLMSGVERDSVSLELKCASNTSNYLIHRALTQELTNKRSFTASTKTRSEVRGGGRKPWKQKGTGRARAGSIRSPLWRGGGVIFGPKPKQVKLKLNRKEKNLAITTLLVNKYDQTFVFENTSALIINTTNSSLSTGKWSPLLGTKQYVQLLKNRGIDMKRKTLVILSKDNPKKNHDTFGTALDNIPTIDINAVDNLSVKSLLNAEQIIFDSDLVGYLQFLYT
jgi:large subunit ribosomal protein L4|uniref:Large ribosomal subunit protein uL4c n=1 Tax=Octactis speculum TaxID=3111310 RepID=A0A514CPM3_9STRA|nr:ribosomal protein L4 [Dictyocha speculum]QDH81759.1 ribosomal protein L4 [Dictyocha speculum]|tara:strand:+ start:24559 stop:25260 length:702 start_codon:yes stop_codon:yes gene_type:complete